MMLRCCLSNGEEKFGAAVLWSPVSCGVDVRRLKLPVVIALGNEEVRLCHGR